MQEEIGAQPARYHKIRSIEIVGGFLDGARFEFSDSLNCLIGGRGTGKTTVLEFIRYALDALPDGEDNRPLCRDIESLVRANLGGGRIQLTIETKDGLSYIVNRTWGEEPQVCTPDGRPTGISLGHGAFFSADIYSQNQIESISNNPRFQLVLIDSFIEQEIADIQTELNRLYRSMEGNAAEILRVEGEFGELLEGLSELPTVEENLKAFAETQGEDADKINEQHDLKARRDRETRALKGLHEAFGQFRQSLQSCVGQLGNRVGTVLPSDLVAGPNAAVLADVQRAADECAGEVDAGIEAAVERIDQALARMTELSQAIAAAHQEQEQAFRQVIEAHQQAQAQVQERSRLERLRNDLLGKKRIRDEKRSLLQQLQDKRTGLMQRVSELRDRRFQRRQEVAAELTSRLSPSIRVAVEQFGNSQEYEDLLADGLKKAGVQSKRTAAKIVTGMSPVDFARAVRQNDQNALVDLAGLTAEQAGKVILSLGGTQRIFEIEAVELLDLPRIELLDGDTYKDSWTLSTGQKCTTVLPILLLESESPLLIDQPEDNLDNRFIYETVVKSVSSVKAKRQLLFVTHNPNIPVLGDAAKVFVLTSSGKKATVERDGTVDECRSEVETLLEGGREAFELRMQRYGH